jgi:1-acyl-sn-glycerol-3-phosphate acyltransferase
MRTILVDRHGRDMGPVREALQRLKQGDLIGIFPEGRINSGETLLEADTGVAWLALRAQVPVCPVYLHGTPRGRNMVEPFVRGSRVKVIYGDPVDLSPYSDRRKSQEVLREVTDLLMQRLAELGGVSCRRTRPAPEEAEPGDVGVSVPATVVER